MSLRWSSLLLMILFACACSEQSLSEVIISEIFYNPGGADFDTNPTAPFNREWIELYNAGDDVVDLAGWQVGDSQDNTWAAPFPTNTLLAPQQALVVTGDIDTYTQLWGSGARRIEVANFPNLANSPSPSDETVALRNAAEAVVDEVNYDDAFGWPRVNGTQGQSIALLPSGLSVTGNDIGTNWKPAMWGAYGARFIPGVDEHHGSPGIVDTNIQQPFEPSPDAAWSMVILPDSQNYVKSSVDRGIFTQQTEWIRDNRDAFNIQVVLHEGDIVNNNNTNNPSSGNQTSTQQWQNARSSMSVLNGHVPYIMAAGNHDYGTTDAQNRSTNINNYFHAADNPLVDPAEGGILKGLMTPGEIQNAFYEFTAPDGREILVIALEWEPRPATVSWANEIAARPEFADHTAVLLTHAYLLGNDARYSGARVAGDHSGQDLWRNLVSQHENFEMTFNGHFGGDGAGYQGTRGTHGNLVHQMFFNTQFETYGGDGWLRVVEFLDDGTTVRVRTYSPFHDMVRDHPQFQFEFQISPLSVLAALPGDYNSDGVVDAADYAVWRASYESSNTLPNDTTPGSVTVADFTIWRANFGRTAATETFGGAGPSVPEIASWVLWLTGTGGLSFFGSSYRRRTRDGHWLLGLRPINRLSD